MQQQAMSHREVRLVDYRPPAWRVEQVELAFDLDSECTVVHSTLWLVPDPTQPPEDPLLNGEALELVGIQLDGRPLSNEEWRIEQGRLQLLGVRQPCRLETHVRVHPARNDALQGLYTSGGLLLTQCEAEGFRRITWFVDRPDVMACYSVLLRADRKRYPVLLANGNREAGGELDDGRHWVRYVDPHPKPSYLFALVAGELSCVETPFTTAEGREVDVRVWAAADEVDRCRYALDATLRAMRWDEQRFGRCYDLAEFNIVAAQDFTMGAMENKGLNIFNARYILADIDSATDADFEAVESVIGHEYFHNWSGNRVTLRDWFQLSLKEGLTVFRDQLFTADLRSAAQKRIDDVRLLKARQFAEDAGSLAHPVRPPSYREINNFYTATVYEKGAEVVRMLHLLLGEDTFRRGLDRYFADNDGHAATVEDFLAAMEAESGRSLGVFARWYAQSGTPVLQVRDGFDAGSGEYRLEIRQHTPPTPDQTAKQPLLIPLRLALYGADDEPLALPPEGGTATDGLVEIDQAVQTLVFRGLQQKPLPSLLQGLSAPARLDYPYSGTELARLARIDQDPVNRWQAVQQLARGALAADAGPQQREALIDAVQVLLDGALAKAAPLDAAFVASCLELPDFAELIDTSDAIDVDALLGRRRELLDTLATRFQPVLEQLYAQLALVEPDALTPAAASARRLKNLCLAWLGRIDANDPRLLRQFEQAGTLTDRLAALRILWFRRSAAASAAMAAFRAASAAQPLLTDKALSLVAARPDHGAIDDIAGELQGSEWQPRNPNRVRALLGVLARGNPTALHRADGAGYRLLFEQVGVIDTLNPQVASRLLGALEYWQRLDPGRRAIVGEELERLGQTALSRDSGETLERLRAVG